jgi:hypothetical protein
MDDTDYALGNQESVGGDAHGRVMITCRVICALVMPQYAVFESGGTLSTD